MNPNCWAHPVHQPNIVFYDTQYTPINAPPKAPSLLWACGPNYD